jgi:predicted phosphodiesterase
LRRKPWTDLSSGRYLHPVSVKDFEEIAPVYAVRGNRDIFYGEALPELRLEVNGVSTVLLMGRVSWLTTPSIMVLP